MGYTTGTQTRWQTAAPPVLAAADHTPLTNHIVSELTDTIKENQVICVAPHSAIAVAVAGKDADAEALTLEIWGFMDPIKDDTQAMFPLYQSGTGGVALANNASSHIPVNDGTWGTSAATWFYPDAYGQSFAYGNGTTPPNWEIAKHVVPSSAATDSRTFITLQTMGFTHLLFEVVCTTAAEAGVMWRPLISGNCDVPGA